MYKFNVKRLALRLSCFALYLCASSVFANELAESLQKEIYFSFDELIKFEPKEGEPKEEKNKKIKRVENLFRDSTDISVKIKSRNRKADLVPGVYKNAMSLFYETQRDDGIIANVSYLKVDNSSDLENKTSFTLSMWVSISDEKLTFFDPITRSLNKDIPTYLYPQTLIVDSQDEPFTMYIDEEGRLVMKQNEYQLSYSPQYKVGGASNENMTMTSSDFKKQFWLNGYRHVVFSRNASVDVDGNKFVTDGLFVDGDLVDSKTIEPSEATKLEYPLSFGAVSRLVQDGKRKIEVIENSIFGSLDEIRLYRGPMSDTDIKCLYESNELCSESILNANNGEGISGQDGLTIAKEGNTYLARIMTKKDCDAMKSVQDKAQKIDEDSCIGHLGVDILNPVTKEKKTILGSTLFKEKKGLPGLPGKSLLKPSLDNDGNLTIEVGYVKGQCMDSKPSESCTTICQKDRCPSGNSLIFKAPLKMPYKTVEPLTNSITDVAVLSSNGANSGKLAITYQDQDSNKKTQYSTHKVVGTDNADPSVCKVEEMEKLKGSDAVYPTNAQWDSATRKIKLTLSNGTTQLISLERGGIGPRGETGTDGQCLTGDLTGPAGFSIRSFSVSGNQLKMTPSSGPIRTIGPVKNANSRGANGTNAKKNDVLLFSGMSPTNPIKTDHAGYKCTVTKGKAFEVNKSVKRRWISLCAKN